jgi:hypothetical protein
MKLISAMIVSSGLKTRVRMMTIIFFPLIERAQFVVSCERFARVKNHPAWRRILNCIVEFLEYCQTVYMIKDAAACTHLE